MSTQYRKLGRKAVLHDSRTLKLASYLGPTLPLPPISVDWTKGLTDWGMMLNDQLGCCTICGCAHAIQTWSTNVGTEITVPDSEILSLYKQWNGYNPADPSTDQGGIELNVLNNWKKNNFVGHQLLAFTSVNMTNIEEVQQAIHLFGGLYIGVALPISAQNQDIWSVVKDKRTSIPNSWGGHCVYVCGYDKDYLTCITWGKIQRMKYNFWLKYVDEAYALIGQDFFNDKGIAPQGFDKNQLLEDLTHIR
jgi:hypothetical protein